MANGLQDQVTTKSKSSLGDCNGWVRNKPAADFLCFLYIYHDSEPISAYSLHQSPHQVFLSFNLWSLSLSFSLSLSIYIYMYVCMYRCIYVYMYIYIYIYIFIYLYLYINIDIYITILLNLSLNYYRIFDILFKKHSKLAYIYIYMYV